MALEKVFECPRTLSRLRTGPLGKLLEGFCHWLLDRGFSRGCIRTHLSNVSHLNQYLGRAVARPYAMVTAKDIEEFFKAYPSQCRNHGPLQGHLRRVRWSINRFTEYLGDKGLFDPLVSVPIYQELLDDYLRWLRHYRHVVLWASPKSLLCSRNLGLLDLIKIAIKYMNYCENSDIIKLSELIRIPFQLVFDAFFLDT